MNPRRTAIIAGASGLTGSYCLKMLLENDSYDKVVSLVRKSAQLRHPKLKEVVVDFDNIEQTSSHLNGNDFFCCLGTTIKKAGSQAAFKKVDYEYPLTLAHICEKNGFDQFLIVTALGADAGSSIFYNRIKGETEEALLNLSIPSIKIFQPSLILGERNESRFAEKMAQKMMPRFNFLLQGPLQKYRPIRAEDIAKAMVWTALHGEKGKYRYMSDQIQKIANGSSSG